MGRGGEREEGVAREERDREREREGMRERLGRWRERVICERKEM